MRLRFTEYCAGPTGGYPAGTVHEVDEPLARRYVELGRAVVEPSRARKPAQERTTRSRPPETAVTR